MLAAMQSAFPQSSGNTACVTVCTVPFLLEPALALQSARPGPVHWVIVCARFTVYFVVGVAGGFVMMQ